MPRASCAPLVLRRIAQVSLSTYKKKETCEEIAFIELIIKPME
jgi:hypothetical protein